MPGGVEVEETRRHVAILALKGINTFHSAGAVREAKHCPLRMTALRRPSCQPGPGQSEGNPPPAALVPDTRTAKAPRGLPQLPPSVLRRLPQLLPTRTWRNPLCYRDTLVRASCQVPA